MANEVNVPLPEVVQVCIKNKYLGRPWSLIGGKCYEFIGKSVSQTIYKFLSKHMRTATLCGYGGKLAMFIATEGQGSMIPVNCKAEKNNEFAKIKGLSDEDVIAEAISGYMDKFGELIKEDA